MGMTTDERRFLVTVEAAKRLRMSQRTLEKHRTYGTGPPYYKLGGRVLYEVCDLDAWMEPARIVSTSDPSAGAVSAASLHAAVAPRYLPRSPPGRRGSAGTSSTAQEARQPRRLPAAGAGEP